MTTPWWGRHARVGCVRCIPSEVRSKYPHLSSYWPLEHIHTLDSSGLWVDKSLEGGFSRLTGVDLYMLAYVRDCTRLTNIDYGGSLQHMNREEKENWILKCCKSIWHLASCNFSSRYTAACKDELKHRCRSGPGRSMFRQRILWKQDLSRLWQRWISIGTSLPIVVTGKERKGLGYKVPKM